MGNDRTRRFEGITFLGHFQLLSGSRVGLALATSNPPGCSRRQHTPPFERKEIARRVLVKLIGGVDRDNSRSGFDRDARIGVDAIEQEAELVFPNELIHGLTRSAEAAIIINDQNTSPAQPGV